MSEITGRAPVRAGVRPLSTMPAKLTTCVHCGHQVSVSATTCPSCHKDNPEGVACQLCSKRIPWPGPYFHDWWDDYKYNPNGDFVPSSTRDFVCDSCLTEHFAPPAGSLCPDCGKQLPMMTGHDLLVVDVWQHARPCPACGNSRPFPPIDGCELCGMPIFSFQPCENWHDTREGTYTPGKVFTVHVFCARRQPARRQPVGKSGCLAMVLAVVGVGVVLLLLFAASYQ